MSFIDDHIIIATPAVTPEQHLNNKFEIISSEIEKVEDEIEKVVHELDNDYVITMPIKDNDKSLHEVLSELEERKNKLETRQYDIQNQIELTTHPTPSLSASGFTILKKDGEQVAEVYGSDEEAQKLANLLAAAPLMLSFLYKVNAAAVGTNENFINNLYDIPESNMSFKNLIKSIIAKAEGK